MSTETKPLIDPLAAVDWELCCQNPDCYDHDTATHLAVKWCGCEPWLCSTCANDAMRRRDTVGEWTCLACVQTTEPGTRYGDTFTLLPLRGRP